MMRLLCGFIFWCAMAVSSFAYTVEEQMELCRTGGCEKWAVATGWISLRNARPKEGEIVELIDPANNVRALVRVEGGRFIAIDAPFHPLGFGYWRKKP